MPDHLQVVVAQPCRRACGEHGKIVYGLWEEAAAPELLVVAVSWLLLVQAETLELHPLHTWLRSSWR